MSTKVFEQWIGSGTFSISKFLLKKAQLIGLNAEDILFISFLLDHYQSFTFLLDLEDVVEAFSVSEDQVFIWIQELVQKKCLSIVQVENNDGKKQDQYSLKPLFLLINSQERVQKHETIQQQQRNILMTIEQEFGRTLSAFEIQTVTAWIDENQYSIELIEAALKEAILNQVFALNYMDKILLTWNRKGIHTLQQVIANKRSHQQGNIELTSSKQSVKEKVPLQNWLRK